MGHQRLIYLEGWWFRRAVEVPLEMCLCSAVLLALAQAVNMHSRGSWEESEPVICAGRRVWKTGWGRCAHSCLVQGELHSVPVCQGMCSWLGLAEHIQNIGSVAGPIQHIQYPAQQRPWEPGKPALDRLRWGRLGKTHLVWPRSQVQIEKWFNSLPFELWRKKISNFGRKLGKCPMWSISVKGQSVVLNAWICMHIRIR